MLQYGNKACNTIQSPIGQLAISNEKLAINFPMDLYVSDEVVIIISICGENPSTIAVGDGLVLTSPYANERYRATNTAVTDE